MKKIIAFLLCMILLWTCGMPILSAVEVEENTPPYQQLRDRSITYSCSYDSDNAKIIVSGTVNHDVMITHSDFMIRLYRLLPGESVTSMMENENASPLASTEIAIKFQFSVSASRVEHRFARYAVVIVSPSGEKILAAEPQYVGEAATYTYDEENRFAFKGILSEKTSVTGSMGFGTAVVPVYLDQVFSQVSHGYLHLMGDTYHYFDEAYIDQLDAQIRTYSASGTRVYLQLLLRASDVERAMADGTAEGALYAMPDVFSQNVLSSVCALSEFLSLRYDQYQSGTIDGIIVGKQIDRQSMNYNGGLTLQRYAEKYAFYVLVVANAVRLNQPEMDIVIPFGNVNAYTGESVAIGVGDYKPSSLLESILSILEQRNSEPFACNVLIESSTVPFNISNEAIDKGMIDTASVSSKTMDTENLHQFIQYMQGLKASYDSAPQHVMYVWTVPETLWGNALACAYAYSYYRLLQEPLVSTFIISFEEAEQHENHHSVVEMKKILRYINTDKSLDVTKHLLPYFDAHIWGRVIDDFDAKNIAQRSVYLSSVLQEPDRKWTGSFSYVNFESGDVVDWFMGNQCKKINTLYGMNSMRGLTVTMQRTENETYSELLCLYQYPENFVYTSMMKFTVALTDSSLSSDSLYEVVLTIGDENASLTSEHLISGNSLTELWVDLGEYSEAHMVNYMKISVRMLHGDAEEYALWVYDVTGMSEEYTSEELTTLIMAERMRIRDEALIENEEDQNRDLILMVFGILLTITIVGVGLYIGLYRTRGKESESDSDEESTK